jgi:hypothetical protein
MKRSDDEKRPDDWDLTGLCDEAQADGVPCFEAGRQCETCARATRPGAAPPEPAPPRRKPASKKRR